MYNISLIAFSNLNCRTFSRLSQKNYHNVFAGPLTSSGLEALAFLTTNGPEKEGTPPNMQLHFTTFGAGSMGDEFTHAVFGFDKNVSLKQTS